MADSSLGSSVHYNTLGLKHTSSSIFSISGFLVGSAKGSSNPESVRSPASPLDFTFFSNPSNPFSVWTPRSSSQSGQKKQWYDSKVGLGVINSLVHEPKLNCEIIDLPQRKNILFGPQVKTSTLTSSKHCESITSFVKSNSLPRNYVMTPLSENRNHKDKDVCLDVVSKSKEFSSESKSCTNIITYFPDSPKPSSCLTSSHQNCFLEVRDFCTESENSIVSSPPVKSLGSHVDYSLEVRPSSLPIPIGLSRGHMGSLSAGEIELSEDYTCIISHGPNPKKTHIFGDCILQCPINEMTNFGKRGEEPRSSPPQISKLKLSEESTTYPFDMVLSFCYSCNKKLEEGQDIYIYRGEKAFCSSDCRAEEIFAEEELEKTYNDKLEISPDSSYHEDFLLLDLPAAA
ncbi:Pre-mRNA cleavage complex 2 protein Pcf11, putative isoform 2 [Quillaja saponaria]|uniref:Pre-mRNA cleavage complex 2 protein Pcf11, putative isoform 2 n=1 Tax=Quillaja saponaria TaxID=32244 RepID=A0AAD7LT98_QUISA|nr:Pre-mRNA cleavage complex 2 protein Pcf11, putative isoform 2 [Quillaja saponaria]